MLFIPTRRTAKPLQRNAIRGLGSDCDDHARISPRYSISARRSAPVLTAFRDVIR